ncbi:MAG: aromatic aminobenezylarsenical efflux permease ArsG family transporter [Chitinispirillaceae bacterium]|nr:aromatic aminobenezylarsenical efflux permease ArsG family transporter [Chitinispirillaceae bacterium]
MCDLITASGMAIWFGIMTSISPCPLATNIAAISFLGKQVNKPILTLVNGLFYAIGRTIVYIVLGFILVSSSSLAPQISFFLQKNMKYIIGPLLLIIGVILLDIIKITFIDFGTLISQKYYERIAKSGMVGATFLGIIFALAFCPVSAALFFGSTFALAMQHNSKILLPALYGIGTAAPVILFAFIIAFSVNTVGNIFRKIQTFERLARIISGIIFIIAGLYFIFNSLIKIF